MHSENEFLSAGTKSKICRKEGTTSKELCNDTLITIIKNAISGNFKTFVLRILKNILLFQKKLFFISYAISILIAIIFGGGATMIGLSFLIALPFSHYLFYEIKNNSQYYYYYNIGLNNLVLWSSTILIAITNLIILMLI